MRRSPRAVITASALAFWLPVVQRAVAADPSPATAPRSTEARPEPRAEPPAGSASHGTGSSRPVDTSPATTAPSSAPSPDADREAEAAFELAHMRYANGDVAGARDAMAEAYRLSNHGELLYNLGQLERELRHACAALDDYQRYLERATNGAARLSAEQAVRELAVECPSAVPPAATAGAATANPVAEAPAPAAPPPPPPARADRRAHYWTPYRTFGWAALSAGAVSGGVSLYFTLAAKSAHDDVAAALHSGVPWDRGNGPARQDDQIRDQRWARAFAVGAGALVTTGILLLVLGPADRAPDVTEARVIIAPGQAALGYRRQF